MMLGVGVVVAVGKKSPVVFCCFCAEYMTEGDASFSDLAPFCANMF